MEALAHLEGRIPFYPFHIHTPAEVRMQLIIVDAVPSIPRGPKRGPDQLILDRVGGQAAAQLVVDQRQREVLGGDEDVLKDLLRKLQ